MKSKRLTPRQRVLKVHPGAVCRWHWPEVWVVYRTKSFRHDISYTQPTPSAAWADAARRLKRSTTREQP